MTEPTEPLKNCPFCGAAAHFEMDDGRWEWVECESCGMQGNRSASLMEDCKPKLAEAWNRRTPQPTQAQAVNQADRPFIVRLAEDFADDCVTAGYVTTKAASYGRLMDEALSTQAQAGAVPLTDGQIRAMTREHPAEDLCGWSYRMGVADAERHHGIKGGQHGADI